MNTVDDGVERTGEVTTGRLGVGVVIVERVVVGVVIVGVVIVGVVIVGVVIVGGVVTVVRDSGVVTDPGRCTAEEPAPATRKVAATATAAVTAPLTAHRTPRVDGGRPRCAGSAAAGSAGVGDSAPVVGGSGPDGPCSSGGLIAGS